MTEETSETTQTWWEGFFKGPFGDLQLAEDDPDGVNREVDLLERRLALAPESHVLDIPCGAGRHSLELARRGHRVTGVDFNEKTIEEARRHGASKRLDVDLRVGDMRDAHLPGDHCRAP